MNKVARDQTQGSGRKKGTSHHFLSPDSVYTAVGKVVHFSFLSLMSGRNAGCLPGGKSTSGGSEESFREPPQARELPSAIHSLAECGEQLACVPSASLCPILSRSQLWSSACPLLPWS